MPISHHCVLLSPRTCEMSPLSVGICPGHFLDTTTRPVSCGVRLLSLGGTSRGFPVPRRVSVLPSFSHPHGVPAQGPATFWLRMTQSGTFRLLPESVVVKVRL